MLKLYLLKLFSEDTCDFKSSPLSLFVIADYFIMYHYKIRITDLCCTFVKVKMLLLSILAKTPV